MTRFPGMVLRSLVIVSVVIGVGVYASLRAAVTAVRGGRAEARRVLGDGAVRLVAALGPAFVKGAQLLSTRRDALPESWCTALSTLYDQVPPMRVRSARRILRRAWPGCAAPEIAWHTVRSGSIACVYRAEIDGRAVAVKVLRPGVRRTIDRDFALLRMGAMLLQRLPGLRGIQAVTVLRQVGDAVAAQTDLAAEAQALTELRATFADVDALHVPAPLPAWCSSEVLVMEFVERLAPVDETMAPERRRALVRLVLHCTYRMVFLHGLVHCDMHPGNLYLRPDGRIVLLDAGFVVRLEPRVRRLFAEFFLHLSRGNGPWCAETVRQSASGIAEDADLAGFRADMTNLVAESTGRRARDFDLSRFAARLFDLQRRHGLSAAPEFVFPLLALLILEGRVGELDPDVDFQAAAAPVLTRAVLSGLLIGH